jgi:hypothetical protein
MAKSFPNTGATVIDSVADLPAASGALEGVMMFQKDTNELKICDGSSWISMLDTDTPNGMVLLRSANPSGSAVYDATSIFNSAFRDYYIELVNISVTSGAADMAIQLIDSTGAVKNSGYACGMHYTLYNGTGSNQGTTTAYLYGGSHAASNATGAIRMWLNSPALAAHTGFRALLNNYDAIANSGAVIQDGTSYTGIRFATSNSSTWTGNLRIYGLRDTI